MTARHIEVLRAHRYQLAAAGLTEKVEAIDAGIAALQQAVDRNVEAVRESLRARSAVGIGKYGTTTERGDLARTDWLRHLQEELLDAAVYIEAAISNTTGVDA